MTRVPDAADTRWQLDGWQGWIDLHAGLDPMLCLRAARAPGGRRSRHARTLPLPTPRGTLYVKTYDAPDGHRAARAFRMGRALATAGFGAPASVLVGRRGSEGLLVTRDVGGEDLTAAVVRRRGHLAAKRRLLRRLGAAVACLHAVGFVHGDLVPPNVRVDDDGFVFLDNDRTRRSRILARLVARRNLVQLGRFVVPGVTLADRLRVLDAYATARGISPRAHRRLASWLVRKIVARRCAIDHVPPAVAARSGFRRLMQSGGPLDPVDASGAA